jgi:hypothetical protein
MEAWQIGPNGPGLQWAIVTGRERIRGWRKLSPVWWFLNDEEPQPPAWHKPDSTRWWRVASWYLRNPFQNFGKYIVGVYDRNYTVTGTDPVCATDWLDVPPGNRTGFKWSVIRLSGGIRLPFVSYVGKRVCWYMGWQWWGFFGFKFNILKSKLQGW